MTDLRPRSQCTKSAKILQSFLADPNHPESALNAIPKAVLARAKGSAQIHNSVTPSPCPGLTSLDPPRRFAIFTVLKAGFVWSAKAGSGIVIARLEDGTVRARPHLLRRAAEQQLTPSPSLESCSGVRRRALQLVGLGLDCRLVRTWPSL